MTLQTQISKKCFNPTDPDLVNYSPEKLNKVLRSQGCNGCELGLQEGLIAPVVYRGNPYSRRMLLGEAPGLEEMKMGVPFCGPSGALLDKIFLAAGWDTDTDFFTTNCVLCRPIAPEGSGRENLTPTEKHCKACRPYLNQLIRRVDPRIIVFIGKVATVSLFPEKKNTPMKDLAGTVLHSVDYPDTTFYVLFHTAYLLRAQNFENGEEVKQQMWKHVQDLKKVVGELEG